MPAVDPATVTALLEDNVDHAPTAVAVITTMAKAYTRGQGFVVNVPNEDIEAVIITAAARLAGNASQASQSVTAGVFTRDLRSYFTGWTLAEQMVLNRYRKRASKTRARARAANSVGG